MSKNPSELLALPELPDNDADFTPDLARKIIAKYQELLRAAASQAEAAPVTTASCSLCGRPFNEHSLHTADTCNFFIPRTVPANESDAGGTRKAGVASSDDASQADIRKAEIAAPGASLSYRDGLEAAAICAEQEIQNSNQAHQRGDQARYAETGFEIACETIAQSIRELAGDSPTLPRPQRSEESNGRGDACSHGDCVEYRNMNGGCDVCGAPCL